MKYLILIIVMLLGCSDPQPKDRSHLDLSWCLVNEGEGDRELVQAALDQWNHVGANWTLGECNAVIERLDDLSGVAVDAVGGGRVGDISYSSGLEGARLLNVLLHELGHAARLDHSDNEGDIMYPVVTGLTKLSDHDIAAFNQIN